MKLCLARDRPEAENRCTERMWRSCEKNAKCMATSALIKIYRRWDERSKGRELYRFFPEISARLGYGWVEPDYETSRILTEHGCYWKRLCDLGLNKTSVWSCGQTDEDMLHVLWLCPLYDKIRRDTLNGMKVGPVYYADLVGSQVNFRRLVEFTHA
ncbi:Retrovirus-related Pol polyprotein from type-1 retrotransposable element R1 4 [Eumeta japonica]|uniref:Retrovirus-related Pol polyprotein from type-1 retrotransposable element R1 4 n=1 Tax=Eumeta variegata TaxID=151549 RepID=A0A4C1SF17_EUMVA|nr:Retrovirus-related Pol polyprotein from type-1 retrotransposable element R1 4 [Eumeta japonica]